MPFIQPESWEVWKYEKWNGQIPNIIIPLYDEAVWEYFRKLRPYMNKMFMAHNVEYPCAPMGILPESFPVFCKPVYNVYGSGGGFVCKNEQEYLDNYKPGFFYMPYFAGEHRSVDALVHNGIVYWTHSAIGHPLTENRFACWELVDTKQEHFDFIKHFITYRLNLLSDSYDGAINFEFLGNNLIEVHFRFASQWCEFYGDEWFESLISLYKDKKKLPINQPAVKGYSFPIWLPFIPEKMFKHPMVMDTRLDECNKFNKWKRIAFINTTDYETGKRIQEQAWRWLYNNNPTW